jgi:hypothetical protein
MSKEAPHLGLMMWTDLNGTPRPMIGSIEHERRAKLHEEKRLEALSTPEGQQWLKNSPLSMSKDKK